MATGFLIAVARDALLAFSVAVCWGVLFGTPRRVLWVAGVLGGCGHCFRFVLLDFGAGLILATLLASILIGLAGIVFAHKVDNPPVVFTMPACITMVPGLYAYRSMLGGIKITDMDILHKNPALLAEIAHNIMLTFSLLAALAVGISVGVLLFRKRSVRDISLGWK